MHRILVATDFSTRSDRALRRGYLLARQSLASILLIHVVDDDLPRQLAETRRQEATTLLHELSQTARKTDGIDCESRVVFGDPFRGIANAAEELDVDLLLLGPHRRQVLSDIFFGTTAERTIRISRRPVLMANGVPAGLYHTVLIAMDFSDCSVIAAQTAKRLGFLEQAQTTALHVIEDVRGPVARASISMHENSVHLLQEEERAQTELHAVLTKVGITASERVEKLAEESISMAINNWARRLNSDLVVVGTHGRSGFEKWLLGSVAERVLAHSTIDVLAVPADAIVGTD